MEETRPSKRKTSIATLLLATVLAVPAAMTVHAPKATAAGIEVVVNDQAVTSYDIARRTAFLRLQRRQGNLQQAATDELIEEALKRSAVEAAGYRIPDSQVDAAFANFARQNNISESQLRQILGQSGVTVDHFREFIRLQIGWGYVVRSQGQGGGQLLSEQEVVAKMLERGGAKPTSTEYTLQRVVFVVPEAKRGSLLAARRQEANNMRGRLNGCDGTFDLATNLKDVTVQDLGRFLELRLPDEWADEVKGLNPGDTTRVKDTQQGVEFLVVCSARSVNDDRVAQLEFSTQDIESGGETGAKLLEQLRKNARIKRR